MHLRFQEERWRIKHITKSGQSQAVKIVSWKIKSHGHEIRVQRRGCVAALAREQGHYFKSSVILKVAPTARTRWCKEPSSQTRMLLAAMMRQAHPFRQPWAQARRGDCRVPAGGHCSINATRVQSFASSGCRKKEASTEGSRAAEWASCNFEGFEGSSISNYRSR